jgi:hypothetical protein
VNLTEVVRPRLLILAGALGAISIGLPWAQVNTPGWAMWLFSPIVPPCAGDYCIEGAVISVIPMGGSQYSISGVDHPIRVVAALAAVLIWYGVRHSSTVLARRGLLLAAAGLAISAGSGLHTGQLVFAVALLVAAAGLGLLPDRRQPVTTGRSTPRRSARAG